MAEQFTLQVENDLVERISCGRPIVALRELILNAYDADAKEVRVEFETGPLTSLGTIRIIDDGDGIPYNEAKQYFESIGGSWKGAKSQTASGRVIHDKKGQGRFKAFALGNSVSWISHCNGQQFSIQGRSTNFKKFSLSDPVPSSETGCVVEITDIEKDFEIRLEHGFDEKIREDFALKIHDDSAFSIIYDGREIDPRESIEKISPYDLVYTGESCE